MARDNLLEAIKQYADEDKRPELIEVVKVEDNGQFKFSWA